MGFRKSDYGVYNACKQCGTISCHKHMISQAPTQKSTYKYDYNDKDKVGCRGLSKVKDTIFQFEDKKKTEKMFILVHFFISFGMFAYQNWLSWHVLKLFYFLRHKPELLKKSLTLCKKQFE